MTSTSLAEQQDTPTTKNRTRKFRFAVAAVAAAAGMVLIGAPGASAATTSTAKDFIVWGADGVSYFRGTATFNNRSVNVAGYFHAVGCRRFYASSHAGSTQLDIRSTSTHCDTTTWESIPLDANVVGGANRVRVALTDQNGQNGRGGDIYRD